MAFNELSVSERLGDRPERRSCLSPAGVRRGDEKQTPRHLAVSHSEESSCT